MDEAADAIDDSEDEVDYTKMDQGNKKGPIGRWDFDTQEEYSDYMANKEALPKWVYQSSWYLALFLSYNVQNIQMRWIKSLFTCVDIF